MKTKKTGRPRKPYVASWGESINGLRRRENDGRWVIVATGEMFSQADERLAVAHFHRKTDPDRNLKITVPHEDGVDYAVGNAPSVADGETIDGEFCITQYVSPAILWAWLRKQLITRPQWVAEQVGIEQIGYLHDLKKPTKSPTLEEVGDLYFAKSKISGHWLAKSKTIWNEFRDAVAPSITLRDLTQEQIIAYQDHVEEHHKSQTAIKHRFGQVKTILAFSKKRGKWAEDRTQALAYCTVLVTPAQGALKPSPIDPRDFAKLLGASDLQMRAMLLVALNCCMYAQEVADLDWTDLDLDAGTLVTDRNKTGVVRVAVLWPETIAALREIPRSKDIDAVFVTEATRQRHNANTIQKAFRKLRAAVKLPAINFAQLRDGAYTAAASKRGVDFQHAQMLAGHKTGMADHYVQRMPHVVEYACLAIREKYFAAA